MAFSSARQQEIVVVDLGEGDRLLEEQRARERKLDFQERLDGTMDTQTACRRCCCSCCVLTILAQLVCFWFLKQVPGLKTAPPRVALPGTANYMGIGQFLTLGYPGNMDDSVDLGGLWWANSDKDPRTFSYIVSFAGARSETARKTFPREIVAPTSWPHNMAYADTMLGRIVMLAAAYQSPENNATLSFSEATSAKVELKGKFYDEDPFYIRKSTIDPDVWEKFTEDPKANPAAQKEDRLLRIVDEIGSPTAHWQEFTDTMLSTDFTVFDSSVACMRQCSTVANLFAWFCLAICPSEDSRLGLSRYT